MIIRGFTRSIYFYAVLISLSLVVVSLSKPGIAESLNSTKAAPRTYHIPAGYLHDALIQFSQQAGIKLAIDSAMLQGKVTLGLTGDFEIKPALDQLLTGSGLQVVQQGMAIYFRKYSHPRRILSLLHCLQYRLLPAIQTGMQQLVPVQQRKPILCCAMYHNPSRL